MTITQNHIANTIISQIPASLRMALGVRDISGFGNGVKFRITGTRTVWVTVRLNSMDLYDLQCFTVRNSGRNINVRYEATDIYAAEMITLLDQMDRGQIKL